MKTLGLKRAGVLFFLAIGSMAVNGQQYDAEVPGDNFSLEGALELFKKSDSPETFEKLLNSSESKVNNLDLNEDGYIDYIRVIDRNEGNVHAFILQAVISERESQDVAVIELEKLANGKAVLQITGDADIYGIETIIEPTEEVRVNAGASTSRRVVNVWTWPSVQYVYSPYYTSVWVSPWHYSYRPVWYRPWRPVAYHVYSPYWRPYRSYYSVCHTHRVTYAHQLYRPYRTTSVIVYNRHYASVKQYRSSRHDYDHNGYYKHGDTGKRDTRGASTSSDSRSSRRQYEQRSSYDKNNRQSDSRSTYGSNSRSSAARSSQPPAMINYTNRNVNTGTSTTRRSESNSNNRSTYANEDSRSNTSHRTTTEQRRTENTQNRSNAGSKSRSGQQNRSTQQVEKRKSSESPPKQNNGNSRGQRSTEQSKKGGQ